MAPTPAWLQLQVTPAEPLTLLSLHRPQTDPPHHPHPVSIQGFPSPHLSAGTQSPSSASPSCGEGPGSTYTPPKSLTRGLWCLRRNLMRKTLHTMHRGTLRYVVIEFYKQQSAFNHVCSFGTSGQQQHQGPTRKARSQLRGRTRWMHSASTSWYSRIATECLHEPQDPALWWYSLFWRCSRDSSINPCFRRNAPQPQEPSSPVAPAFVERGAHLPLHVPCAPRARGHK